MPVSHPNPRPAKKPRHPARKKSPGQSAATVAEVPAGLDWSALRRAASSCHACPLYKNATQTVFGKGPPNARIVLIGEQPGDAEDIEGSPFVGPAGKLLDRALTEAGIDRTQCYVTNAVKHFKWEARGKRRLHKKPNNAEIRACRPWWQAELALLKPHSIILLGSTAAHALLERDVKVLSERGSIVSTEWAKHTLITIHPSSLLRIPDPESKTREFAHFVQDLASIKA